MQISPASMFSYTSYNRSTATKKVPQSSSCSGILEYGAFEKNTAQALKALNFCGSGSSCWQKKSDDEIILDDTLLLKNRALSLKEEAEAAKDRAVNIKNLAKLNQNNSFDDKNIEFEFSKKGLLKRVKKCPEVLSSGTKRAKEIFNFDSCGNLTSKITWEDEFLDGRKMQVTTFGFDNETGKIESVMVNSLTYPDGKTKIGILYLFDKDGNINKISRNVLITGDTDSTVYEKEVVKFKNGKIDKVFEDVETNSNGMNFESEWDIIDEKEAILIKSPI